MRVEGKQKKSKSFNELDKPIIFLNVYAQKSSFSIIRTFSFFFLINLCPLSPQIFETVCLEVCANRLLIFILKSKNIIW